MDVIVPGIILRKTPIQLNLATIQALYGAGGGVITVETAPYTDLNNRSNTYWQFFSPYGQPGDLIWIQEKYKVTKVCSELTGYLVTVMFEDLVTMTVASTTSVALTPSGTWIPANSMIEAHSRLKLLITNIAMGVGNTEWNFTTVTAP